MTSVIKFTIWIYITVLFIAIDQLTKLAASYFGWSIFLNDKFAFSLPVPTFVMYLIYAAVLLGMSLYLFKTWNRFVNIQKVAWAFVYAGGISNIVERIILGHVRDFMPISSGMLNVADFFIIIGLVLLLISNRHTKINEPVIPSDQA